MFRNLDLKDRKILFELDLNSKQVTSTIAKKVRLNKNTVHFRIERLVREGYIRSFYPVIDISALGFFSVRVYFNFFSTTAENEEEIINCLVKKNLVAAVAELETVYDIMISVIVKDIYEFENFWNEFKIKYRQYIINEKISIFTKIEYYNRKYLFPDNKLVHKDTIGGNKIINYDKTDIHILSYIKNNSRLSSIELSKKMKIPARTIIYRIKELEIKKVIINYRVDIDLEKIGFQYYKINIKLNSLENIHLLKSFCELHKNIVFIDYTLSDYDFEVDIEVQNHKELNEFIKETKKIGRIRSYEIISFKKYYKIGSTPNLKKE